MSNHSSTFPSYAWHRHELDSQTAPRGGSRYGRDIATLSRGRVMSGDSLKDFHAPDLPPADITPIFSGPHLDLHQLTLRLHILPYPKDWAYERIDSRDLPRLPQLAPALLAIGGPDCTHTLQFVRWEETDEDAKSTADTMADCLTNSLKRGIQAILPGGRWSQGVAEN